MVHFKLVCFLALYLSLTLVYGETRVARSPQFGGFSQASAQAGEFGRPNFGYGQPFGPRPPYFGPRPPFFGPRPPFFGGNFARPQGSINISKSISISAGRGGAASSSSNAGSGGFGK